MRISKEGHQWSLVSAFCTFFVNCCHLNDHPGDDLDHLNDHPGDDLDHLNNHPGDDLDHVNDKLMVMT